MEIIRSRQALKDAIRGLRADGKTIGFVPTMGALHAGHLSLVEIAKKNADAVVVSVFVNPTQFGPTEDFTQYPRTEVEDLINLEMAGVAMAYFPTLEEIYPQGTHARLSVPPIANELDGAFRPGHFEGVAMVVAELFRQVTPDIAVFGEKDYQQLHIVREMARAQKFAVNIIGAPIMREEDGLAMSSRNRYLSDKQRRQAAEMYSVLTDTDEALQEGLSIQQALYDAKTALYASGFTNVDYVELRDAATLAPVTALAQPSRLLAAAHLGTTRLIDNIAVAPRGKKTPPLN